MQGPAEVLPVSSSGHLVLLGSRDKAFEVFLHAATAAALLIALPLPRLRPVTVAPAALAGLALERPVERRLGTKAVGIAQISGGSPASIASGRTRLSASTGSHWG